ncbi:MAG: CO dehydrogenase/acetyl-CoA synthase subunit delta [Promethearchaeota archaeon]
MEDLPKKLRELFKDADEITLKDVFIDAEQIGLEIKMGGGGVPPQVPVTLQIGTQTFSGMLLQTMAGMPAVQPLLRAMVYQKAIFETPAEKYPGEIAVVEFKRSGKGGKVVKLGGEKAPPFYNFEADMPNPPVVTADVFDIPIHTKKRETFLRLAKPVKMHYLDPDVSESPAEWAKLAVNKYGAQMITMHNIGTDPTIPEKLGGKKSAKWAAKNLEDVMQAVKVPIVIGGSGNKVMDIEVFEKCAEVSEAERFMLSSAEDDTFEKIVPIAKKYDHNVLAFTSLDLNAAKKLNQEIIDMGLPKDHVVIDPTTAPLGYGWQFSFSIYQRIRLAALKGEENLQCPMSGGTTNAWGAREAFLSQKKKPEWGPVEYRGPLWEVITAFGLCLAGLNVAMMLHPGAIKSFKQIIQQLTSKSKSEKPNLTDWITMEV